jgi:hypothetical protein
VQPAEFPVNFRSQRNQERRHTVATVAPGYKGAHPLAAHRTHHTLRFYCGAADNTDTLSFALALDVKISLCTPVTWNAPRDDRGDELETLRNRSRVVRNKRVLRTIGENDPR